MATLSFPVTSASAAPTVTTLEASPEAKTRVLAATNKPEETNNATQGLSEQDITSSFPRSMRKSSHRGIKTRNLVLELRFRHPKGRQVGNERRLTLCSQSPPGARGGR